MYTLYCLNSATRSLSSKKGEEKLSDPTGSGFYFIRVSFLVVSLWARQEHDSTGNELYRSITC